MWAGWGCVPAGIPANASMYFASFADHRHRWQLCHAVKIQAEPGWGSTKARSRLFGDSPMTCVIV